MNSTATCSTWREMVPVRLHRASDSPYDENKQPYHTGSVAFRVNKDRAIRRTSGRKCQACDSCIIEDSWKRQHHHRHMEHKDTKSGRETSGANTRDGQVQMNILGLCESVGNLPSYDRRGVCTSHNHEQCATKEEN